MLKPSSPLPLLLLLREKEVSSPAQGQHPCLCGSTLHPSVPFRHAPVIAAPSLLVLGLHTHSLYPFCPHLPTSLPHLLFTALPYSPAPPRAQPVDTSLIHPRLLSSHSWIPGPTLLDFLFCISFLCLLLLSVPIAKRRRALPSQKSLESLPFTFCW